MKLILVIGILLGVIGSCKSQTTGNTIEKDPILLDPDVRYGKLENGFTYYLKNIETPENIIRFDLIVKAGKNHEDNDQREYAHLLEHLAARETKNFPNLKSYFYQEGRTRHAFTKSDHTEYFTSIPKNDKKVFHDGLEVLRDWAQGNEWDPESIAVERAAIEGEMRTVDPHGKWKSKSIEREVFKKMNYRPYDAKKKLESLRDFNINTFYRFYKDWYRPDLQAAIIVGDLNLDSLEKVVETKFGALKGPPNPPDPKKYLDAQTVHFDEKVHFSTVIDSLEQGISLEILRVRPNLELSPKSRADYRDMLLQQLYMVLLEKRAKNLTQQYDPPFSKFWANYRSGNLAGGQINATQMGLTLEGDDFVGLKEQFQRGIKAWKQMHLDLNKKELENTKGELFNNYIKPKLIKDFSERLQDHFVHGKAAPNPELEENLLKELLNEITVRELQKIVEEKGNLDRNTHFIFFKGKKTDLPPYEIFKQWIQEIDTKDIEPLKEPTLPIQSLGDVVEIPASLKMKDLKVKENVVGVSTVELPNGIVLMLKPTEPKMKLYKNRVTIRGFRKNKVPLDNPKDYLAAQAAPGLITFGGAGSYSKFELKRFMNEKQMSLHLSMDKDNQHFIGNSKYEDLPELINLLYLYLAHPQQDPEVFKAWKTHQRNELQGRGTRGSAAFIMKKISQLWYPEVPVMEMKDLEKLSAEQVYRAAQQWFSSLEDFTFIVTGDFDTNKVLPVLVDQFSGFPTKKEQRIASTKHFNFCLKKMQEKLEFKNIDAAYVRLFFPVKAQKDLKTQIELRLLSLALHQRIWDRLREGSYAPIAMGEWLEVENGIFAFRIEFDSTLGDEERMIAWALEEFRDIRTHGVDKEWLDSTLGEEVIKYESGFGSFHYYDFWGDYIQSKLKNREDIEKEALEYGTVMEHFINLDDVNNAAKKYMKEEHLQQFVGFPEGYQELK